MSSSSRKNKRKLGPIEMMESKQTVNRTTRKCPLKTATRSHHLAIIQQSIEKQNLGGKALPAGQASASIAQ